MSKSLPCRRPSSGSTRSLSAVHAKVTFRGEVASKRLRTRLRQESLPSQMMPSAVACVFIFLLPSRKILHLLMIA